MKFEASLRILKKVNELIALAKSIACGCKPTARCLAQVDAWLTLRKVSK